MQRLEVSGAVRPIYGSLGVKRLSCPFLSCVYNRRFHLNAWTGWRMYLAQGWIPLT